MATMKTLNGYGFNATELNGKAASDYLQKTDTASDTSKLGGKAPEYYIQPRNLLDNSDFKNPVNQRGIYSAVNGSYIIDRWCFVNSNFTGNTTITQSANGTTITNDAGADTIGILQRFIDKNYYDGKYTVVVKTTDSLIFGYTEVLDSENDIVQASTWLPSGTTVVWAALYEGSYTAETLPPYVPKGYAAELMECQRYFIADVGTHKTGTIVDNIFEMYILLPTQMRIVPTAILRRPDNVVFNIGERKIVAVKSASVTYLKNLLVGITLDIDNTGKQYVIGATYLTTIDLSADL